jgi:hypothetical protein
MKAITMRRVFLMALLLIGSTAQAQVKGPIERYSATTANVVGANEPVTIELLKWSTDADRDRLLSILAWYGDKEVAASMPTVGYVWTSASAGYSIRYAYKATAADGSQRIILLTDRKLGAWSPDVWKPVAAATADPRPFSVIELRVNRAGAGEGKTSLTTKTVVDPATKSLALENYAAQPVILKGVAKK